MKKVVILGSTGSIGTQALEVIRQNRDKFEVVALTCGSNEELLKKQVEEFKPKFTATKRDGMDALIEAATMDADIVLNSLMGMMGLVPTYHAIRAGRDIAFANKETLVAGGEIIMDEVKKNKVKLLPVDSEHSAIFQSLEGNKGRKIKKILLTCSGGPFRGFKREDLEKVTLQDALKHPKWNMGKKITIDSATLMNKGLEIIEAKWLFDVEPEDIQVLIHKESILHSAVEFMDNSVIGQMGIPDMKIPISLALGYPDRLESKDRELDFFTEGSNLTFSKPDIETFKCLQYAYDSIKKGGSYPVVMNAANEVLVDKFLKEEIRFIQIQDKLGEILAKHTAKYDLSLEDILEIDKETRRSLE